MKGTLQKEKTFILTQKPCGGKGENGTGSQSQRVAPGSSGSSSSGVEPPGMIDTRPTAWERKTLAKKIDKKGVWLESKKLYDSNIPGWIQNYLKGEGYSITPKATQMLADFLGTDLHKIANELKKLTIALPKNKSIDDADVERNIGISKDYNVFELQNAIGSRDVLKANRIVNYFGDNGKDNPLLVTAITLYGYFTKILKFHLATDKSQGALASLLGVNPYFVRDYQTAARNYPPQVCIRNISILREFDMKSKGYESGETSEKDLYREMIFKLMH